MNNLDPLNSHLRQMHSANREPPANCLSCHLNELCVFGALASEEIADFRRLRGQCTPIPAGTVLCNEGTLADEIFTIYDGWVLKYRHLENGRRQVVSVALPGDLVGEYADTWSVWQYSAETLTESTLCKMNRALLVSFRKTHPRLAEATIRLARADERILAEHLLSVTRRTAHDGIVHLMLEIFIRLRQRLAVAEGIAIDVPLTQEQIGDMLGLTTEYVNKRLSEIDSEGLISFRRKRLIVHNYEEAVLSVNFSPSYLNTTNASR